MAFIVYDFGEQRTLYYIFSVHKPQAKPGPADADAPEACFSERAEQSLLLLVTIWLGIPLPALIGEE